MADIGGGLLAAFGGPGIQAYMRAKHEQEANEVDFALQNPDILAQFPEIQKKVDKHLGAAGISQSLIQRAHDQDLAHAHMGVLGALLLAQQGKSLGQTEPMSMASGEATISPTGKMTQGTRQAIDLPSRPKTLEDFPMKPGEEVDIGPKGVSYKRKGSVTGETAIDKEWAAARAASESGNTELANLHFQRAHTLGMSPEQKIDQTRAAMEPFAIAAEGRRADDRRQAMLDKIAAAPDEPIKGQSAHFENADGTPVDPGTTWRQIGEGQRTGKIRPKTSLGQIFGNFIQKTFVGTGGGGSAPAPAKTTSPQDLEGKLTDKYLKAGTTQ